MSNTRHATTEGPLRQERYCSSPEFERGLMANLVAKRCDVLDQPGDRSLIYFLQLLSHREGGLKKAAADLVTMFPDRIGTVSMHRFGMRPGQIYSAEQVRAVREELPAGSPVFCLRGERSDLELFFKPEGSLKELAQAAIYNGGSRRNYEEEKEAIARAERQPAAYPASEFLAVCRQYAEDLHDYLAEICVNPAIDLGAGAVWYFPTLIASLREYQAAWEAKAGDGVIVTELGKQVYETLDYALDSRRMVLIDGLARTGKTFAVKAWCAARPGQARYVQVPSTSDDIAFFRAIAKSLGVSINLNSKAQKLRDRVEDVLQRGHLMVCFDEAHYLWPKTNYQDVVPVRVNWIMTALVNNDVPVALVTTPQFMRTQKAVERRSCWTAEQFTGRIGHYQKLPDSLSEADLGAVARTLLPGGSKMTIEVLVRYAQGSAKYLAGIGSVVDRARYLARKEGQTDVACSLVQRAIKESVIPSDTALFNAMSEPEKPNRKARRIAVAGPLQEPFRGSETTARRPIAGGEETNFAPPMSQRAHALPDPQNETVREGGLVVA